MADRPRVVVEVPAPGATGGRRRSAGVSAIAAWLALTTALPAADVRVDDVRLELSPFAGEGRRLDGQATRDDGDDAKRVDVSGTGALTRHDRAGIAYYRSLDELEAGKGSFLWDVAASYDALAAAGLRARGAMLDGGIGWAWAFSPRWHVEHGVVAGAGGHAWRVLDADGAPTGRGFSYEYGIRLGTFYTAGAWQIGVEARYLALRSRIDARTLGPDEDGDGRRSAITEHADAELDGFGFWLAVGRRF